MWLRPNGSASYFSSWITTTDLQQQHWTQHCMYYLCMSYSIQSRTQWMCTWKSICVFFCFLFSYSTTFRGRGLFPNPERCSMLQRWPWHWATSTLWTLSTGKHTQTGTPCKVIFPFFADCPLLIFVPAPDFNMIHTESCMGISSGASILMKRHCRGNVLPKSSYACDKGQVLHFKAKIQTANWTGHTVFFKLEQNH